MGKEDELSWGGGEVGAGIETRPLFMLGICSTIRLHVGQASLTRDLVTLKGQLCPPIQPCRPGAGATGNLKETTRMGHESWGLVQMK